MADRDLSDRMLAILDRVLYPVDVSIGHRGDALAVAVFPAHYEAGSSFESRIWRVPFANPHPPCIACWAS